MNITEELRSLLDERGVEWMAWDGTHPITVWHDETYLYEFVEYRLVNGAKQVTNCPSDNDGHCELTIKVFNCTPQQAIDATLGRGMCYPADEYLDSYSDLTVTVCSGCGVPVDDLAEMNYCPNCGRKVVDE